jgi:hypothetical protein
VTAKPLIWMLAIAAVLTGLKLDARPQRLRRDAEAHLDRWEGEGGGTANANPSA